MLCSLPLLTQFFLTIHQQYKRYFSNQLKYPVLFLCVSTALRGVTEIPPPPWDLATANRRRRGQVITIGATSQEGHADRYILQQARNETSSWGQRTGVGATRRKIDDVDRYDGRELSAQTI
jgi:hypothetical protein